MFLEGVKGALTADGAFRGGWYDEQPVIGLRAAARVYAGWGFSQAFYWDEVWREMGYTSLEDFLVGFVTPEGDVWGRPVGVVVARDGALMVTDDGSGTIWRVAYVGGTDH